MTTTPPTPRSREALIAAQEKARTDRAWAAPLLEAINAKWPPPEHARHAIGEIDGGTWELRLVLEDGETYHHHIPAPQAVAESGATEAVLLDIEMALKARAVGKTPTLGDLVKAGLPRETEKESES